MNFWRMQLYPGSEKSDKEKYTYKAIKEKIIGFGCGCGPVPDKDDQEFINFIESKSLCELSEEEKSKYFDETFEKFWHFIPISTLK